MQTPPKPNYQRELEQTLSTIPAGTKPHLFLHACCAPCSSYVLEYLSRYFTITIYFYNPNIMPEAEFSHRLAELRRLLQEMPLEGTVSVVAGTWEPERFLALAKGHEHEPERGERCQRCIRLRLEQTMQAAKDAHADFVTTTLSISPHKDANFSAVQSWQSNSMSHGYMQISRKRAVISVRLHCPANMTCIGKISAAVCSPPQTAMQHLIKHQKYKKSAAFAAFFHVTPVSRRFSKNLLAIARET